MKIIAKILLVSFLSLIYCTESVAKANKRLLDLTGIWKFSIGDNMSWAEKGFDDSAWDELYVPSSWEDEGYPGYDGYAWYRISFDYDEDFEDRELILNLGFVDDVDEVFLNGVKIGSSGSFPDNFFTTYNLERKYFIPDYLLDKKNKNVIAVRVYDERLQGGMLRGNPGIYTYVTDLVPNIPLSGNWKFIADDNPDYSKNNYDDSDWNNLFVPLRWDFQGYNHYDGFAWYRKSVDIPEQLERQNLILLLGRIDDFDETYFNGIKIGSTGDMENIPSDFYHRKEWNIIRAYYINKKDIKFGSENSIAVRVYDGYNNGGIYDGPIGIITQERYRELKRFLRKKKNIWELIFGD